MFGPAPLLNITRFTIGTFSFLPNEAFEAEREANYKVTVGFAMQRPDVDNASLNDFRVLLDLNFGPGEERLNATYEIRIGLVAYFQTPISLGEDRTKIPARVLNNALMVTYGIARGIVGQATAANERGQFVLPAMTFQELIAKSNASIHDESGAGSEVAEPNC